MTSSEHLNIELDSDGFLEFVSEEAEDARSDLSSWNLVTSDLGGEDWFPVGDDDESPASTGLSGGGTPTAQFLRGEGEGDEGDEALISVEGGLKEVEVIPAPAPWRSLDSTGEDDEDDPGWTEQRERGRLGVGLLLGFACGRSERHVGD